MTIALLAPIPEEHLISGLEVCEREGEVAFGSRAWEVFAKLDNLMGGQPCDCLIYASDALKPIAPPTVTWEAKYLRHLHGKGGAHPSGMKFRPKSTEKYMADNKGHWAVFWHITDLHPLDAAEHIKVGSLRGYQKSGRYLTNFIPEGPILVEW